MGIGLFADSCCDISEELAGVLRVKRAPLIVTVPGGGEYVDDGTADISQLIADLAASEQGAQSTCPSPETYAALMREEESCFVVTLSSKLSGSYNAACVARDMVLEESPEKKIHIFDSKSAVVGETQIALFLREQIDQWLPFEQIVPLGEGYVRHLRTFFVLEDLSNLLKNGRLLKAAGRVATMIKLCPLMGEDGEGQIKLVSPSLGIERSIRKLLDTVAHFTEDAKEHSVRLMLGFCNCLPRAEKVKERLLKKCPALKEVLLVPTGALSTMYANDGGIVVAFPSDKPAGTPLLHLR